jgi:hypothetical protein
MAIAFIENKTRTRWRVLPAVLLALSLAACSKTPADDPVEYSFVVLGDCRVDKADTSYAANPAGINFAELDRSLEDVVKLDPKPSCVFFNGDEIFGYEHDTTKLAKAFAIWRDSVEASPVMKAGIKFVAIPGNHETEVDSGDGKVPSPDAERVWLETMTPLLNGNDGPHAGGPDSLATDQSRLTYSFDLKDSHFVLMNTDPVGQDAHVPAHWIAADLANARKNGAKHLFAIGHKPAFGNNGTMAMAAGNRTDLWDALEANHAEAMIGSHIHIYDRFQPHHAKTWMIISGNGGTPLNENLPPNKKYFGFIVVSILKSGKVILKSYGHDVPAEGYAAACPESKYPTTLRDSLDITWKD